VVIRPRSFPPIVPVMMLPACAGIPDTVTVPQNSAGGRDVPVVGTVVGDVVGMVVGDVVGAVVGMEVG
jgi:tetrahydromethanopterin S-methyltransferase subunit C